MSKDKAEVKSYKAYADKEPTQHHADFAKWIEAQTGVTPDVKTIQLALALVHPYQKSPENRAARAARSDGKAAAAAKKAKATPPKPKAPAKKRPARRRATRPEGAAAF